MIIYNESAKRVCDRDAMCDVMGFLWLMGDIGIIDNRGFFFSVSRLTCFVDGSSVR